MSTESPALRALLVLSLLAAGAVADPCGMVPPIYTGEGPPITRVGEQKTYVFYKDGIETFVIRPGFSGKVDEFGMLIPFPSPPAIRKIDDALFDHVAAAVDPPEVVIDLTPPPEYEMAMRSAPPAADAALGVNDVRVLREEAVGMYEVAVLEAGSAAALKRWMDDKGYRYPRGMDAVCEEYVEDGWCFVAVKTRVGRKKAVNPVPGMREVDPQLPAGFTFDGFVQGMGFRFRSDELVVPMRLSAYNEGQLHNIVYILTDEPSRIAQMPEEMVKRQISGRELYRHLTEPLPLRIVGGTVADLTPQQIEWLRTERNPGPKNGLARELFASDLLAARMNRLAHPFEEDEKVLLRIGERLGLRGPEIDHLHHEALDGARSEALGDVLADLEGMTLTVVDADFPREVLAAENLRFVSYTMPSGRNTPGVYDARRRGPAPEEPGIRVDGPIEGTISRQELWVILAALGAAALFLIFYLVVRPRSRGPTATAVLLIGLLATAAGAQDGTPIPDLIDRLADASRANETVEALVARGREAVPHLVGEAVEGSNLPRRGWAIVCLAEIGGEDVDGRLAEIHADVRQPALVRTWAAAGRIELAGTIEALRALGPLVRELPALQRPYGMKAVGLAIGGQGSPEDLLALVASDRQLQQALAQPVLGLGPEKLAGVLVGPGGDEVRRLAAAYLATMGQEGRSEEVASAVLDAYRFDPDASEVPWKGGALWIPSIQWEREPARALARRLLSWFVWGEEHGLRGEGQQIHNNLRSLQLAAAAGYQSPGWQEVGLDAWLLVWGRAYGRAELEALLTEQGVADQERYRRVLDQVGR